MSWFTGSIVYLLLWWVVLFAVLPFGTRPDVEGDPAAGGWRGAPVAANLGRKVIATTLVSAILWAGVWYLVTSEWLSFRTGLLAMPGP